MKMKYLIVLSCLLTNSCFYMDIWKHKTIYIEFDKYEYDHFQDKTCHLYGLKVTNYTLISNHSSKLDSFYLRKTNNCYNNNCKEHVVYSSPHQETFDYRDYIYSILDTSIIQIDTIEHVELKDYPLGSLKFKAKKDGKTTLVAHKKHGKETLFTEIKSENGIIKMAEKIPKWKRVIRLPWLYF